jgi:hypothetical protein
MKIFLTSMAALALAGCATTYQMNLMPRDSGRLYQGIATDDGTGTGHVDIAIEDKRYSGNWVAVTPDHTHGWVSGGVGYGRHGWGFGGFGASVTMDNPYGTESKALLTAQDGSGLRCDLRSGGGYGGGFCRDDQGRVYDVQLRPAPRG